MKSGQGLGLAAVLAAALPGAAMAEDAALTGTRLSMTVEGHVTAVPDLLTVGAGVATQAPTARAALAANAAAMTRTLAALKSAGVAEHDIQTTQLELSPQMRFAEGKAPVIIGYQANNRVTVRFRKVEAAGEILDALVAAGANQIDGPSFSVSQGDGLLDQARTQAIATAKARADLYARAAGLRVRRLVAVEEQGGGGGPRPMPMMVMARKADATPVLAGEQEQTVTLSVTFELE